MIGVEELRGRAVANMTMQKKRPGEEKRRHGHGQTGSVARMQGCFVRGERYVTYPALHLSASGASHFRAAARLPRCPKNDLNEALSVFVPRNYAVHICSKRDA